MKKFLAAITILAVISLIGLMNYDKIAPLVGPMLGASAVPLPATNAVPVTLGAAPEQRCRFALIDPPTSTDASFRE